MPTSRPPAPARRRNGSATERDQLRLLSKIARMYHERGILQPQIAAELSISQPRVSRLLQRAAEAGIVRTIVSLPSGVYTDTEDEVQEKYGLRDVIVVDADGAAGDVIPALSAATADYLDVTLTGGDIIGISSWSETLIGAVDAMRPKSGRVVEQIVQVVGGIGDPAVQMKATRLTGRLADLTGADPIFMPAPGLVSTPAVRRALMNDASVETVVKIWQQLTVALVGIGSLAPSPLLERSGNAVAEDEQAQLRELGAVGDVCLRFFDAQGRLVNSKLNGRVVGIDPKDFLKVPRRVGVAGGDRKISAIRAALLGGWVNVLITDLAVANRLLAEG